MIQRLAALFLLCALPAFCQTGAGELRLKVTDPSGKAVKSTVLILSEANQYRASLSTNDRGELNVLRCLSEFTISRLTNRVLSPFQRTSRFAHPFQ